MLLYIQNCENYATTVKIPREKTDSHLEGYADLRQLAVIPRTVERRHVRVPGAVQVFELVDNETNITLFQRDGHNLEGKFSSLGIYWRFGRSESDPSHRLRGSSTQALRGAYSRPGLHMINGFIILRHVKSEHTNLY